MTNLTDLYAGGLLNVVEDTTPQLGGILDTNDHQVQWSKGADIASGVVITLGNDGNYFDVTGTSDIEGILGASIGSIVTLHFDGILLLIKSSALALPGGANITTAAGDAATFIKFDAASWRCVSYTKVDGIAVKSKASIWLPAKTADLPATNPAGLVNEPGSTVYAGHSHLTFDDTTSEHAVWRVPMPDYDGGNIVVTAYSKVATTPSGAVTLQYNILTIGLANSEAFDAAVTVDTSVNISHSLSTSTLLTDIMVASGTIDPANVAADDLLVIELSRDVASDNLVGDGELVGIMLKYTRA